MPSFWVAAALAATLQAAPPPQATAPPNPFSHIFQNLATDARSLGTIDTAIVMGFGGAGALAAHNNDTRVHDWALALPPDPGVAKFGNFIGNGFIQGGLATAAWAVGKTRKDARLETAGSDLIRAQVLNGVLTQGIKLIANRTRPDGGSNAFPSGHASATFATAAVIQRDYGVAASVPFYALGGLVSWSRVRTSHHWLSDVVFGGAIGITSGLAATKGRTSHWSVVPVKTTGGAALYVVRR